MGKPRYIEHEGKTLRLYQWADRLKVPAQTLLGRIERLGSTQAAFESIKTDYKPRGKSNGKLRRVVTKTTPPPAQFTPHVPATTERVLLFAMRAILDAPLNDSEARAALSLMLEQAGY